MVNTKAFGIMVGNTVIERMAGDADFKIEVKGAFNPIQLPSQELADLYDALSIVIRLSDFHPRIELPQPAAPAS